jgi:hypothetical protein
MGEDRGVQRVLVGRPGGKRPLGRPRRRWEDNIKMDLQEVGGGHGNWMELAQDRDGWWALVGTVRNKTECNNYRELPNLSTTFKILSNILLSRLTPNAEGIIRVHQ